MLNPFDPTGYNLLAMTRAITKLPNLYNRVSLIFPEQPINMTIALIEQSNGTLNIIRSRPRGAPADKMIADKRALRSFVIPHIPVEDLVLPDEIQGVRAFGSENAEETQAGVVATKLQKMKNAIDQTREFLACGALKGIILDADGLVLYNLYNQFGITAKSIDFDFATATSPILKKCLEVKRWIESHLLGETMTGIRCLCDATFYDALTGHAEVEKAFASYQALNQNLAEDYRRGFRFGGITFEEYSATWTDHDGSPRPAITAGHGICFPEGTGNTFETIVAPGNFLETVNTMGVPYYAKMEEKKFGQGYELWAESNCLPICKRPEVLVDVTIT
jgi:hypothetical protein